MNFCAAIGWHLIDLFQDLPTDYSCEQMDGLAVDYHRIYLARNHSVTSVYPVKRAWR
jgi:hypothetical protein